MLSPEAKTSFDGAGFSFRSFRRSRFCCNSRLFSVRFFFSFFRLASLFFKMTVRFSVSAATIGGVHEWSLFGSSIIIGVELRDHGDSRLAFSHDLDRDRAAFIVVIVAAFFVGSGHFKRFFIFLFTAFFSPSFRRFFERTLLLTGDGLGCRLTARINGRGDNDSGLIGLPFNCRDLERERIGVRRRTLGGGV